MKRFSDILFLFLCFSLSVAVGGLLILSPPKPFSERENRVLCHSLDLSGRALLSGRLAEDISLYCSDQFPSRPLFTETKARCELLLMRLENNGVLFGKDGYTVLSPTYGDLSLYRKNLAAISEFSEEYNACVCFAPRGAEVAASALPRIYSCSALDTTFDMALSALPRLIDTRAPLVSAFDRGEQVWFRSDHHWTQLGAYYGYLGICSAMGLSPTPRATVPETVTEDFLGSVYSRSGRLGAIPDKIELYTPSDHLVVNYDRGEEHTSLYFRERLSGKDKYLCFADGNHGHLGVYPDDGAKKETLVIIKDSFANPLLPFLAEHFALEVYDLRYFSGSIRAELERLRPSGVLLIFGIDTAVTDPSFASLLR
ncbi:MAG: hypothetical protein E7641_06150 [Ruminococcaceae bacterium]|nr:hypothetical protein [Oscillospiraceae bacterium]